MEGGEEGGEGGGIDDSGNWETIQGMCMPFFKNGNIHFIKIIFIFHSSISHDKWFYF